MTLELAWAGTIVGCISPTTLAFVVSWLAETTQQEGHIIGPGGTSSSDFDEYESSSTDWRHNQRQSSNGYKIIMLIW